ncbi:MAG TPA: hypothetical protein VGI39_27975, partial [Polyangiaceae bacterium]
MSSLGFGPREALFASASASASAWAWASACAAVASVLGIACGGNAFTQAASGPGDGGSSGDAGPPLDGGVSGDAATDGGGDFCAAHGAQFDFCSDFDQAGLPENWSTLTRTGNGDMQEDPNASSSPPNSLLATLPALGV